MLRIPGLFRFATVVALSACASSGTVSTAQRSSSDQVTKAEIASSSATNAYELIQRLRPNWLRVANMGSISGGRSQVIVVYLDGVRLGDTDSLRDLSAAGITSMQWLDAAKAATILHEVGSDPIAGAIIIKTH